MVNECTSLLGGEKQGRASVKKTYANIIISILGSGVLGLPYTYKRSGWIVATATILVAGVIAYHCMMLLVKCRDQLTSRGHNTLLGAIQTYPDLGARTFGNAGRRTVEITLLISQVGCCVAYLIFIAHNLSSVLFTEPRYLTIILVLALLETLVSWIRSLSTLAPFSIFANVCNMLAMALVIKEDTNNFKAGGFSRLERYTDWKSIPFALGVSIYCYEGFGMTLSLQSSMKRSEKFGKVLLSAFVLITGVYLVFGFAGYMAFGSKTLDIITLNLDNDEWSTKLVMLGLSVALFFTFPVMMYPVYEIIEMRLLMCEWFHNQVLPSPRLHILVVNLARSSVVLLVAVMAALVPGFGTFISLVGSTVCALLAFVFPALFHLCICKQAGVASKTADLCLLVFGAAFAAYGTYESLLAIFHLH